MGATQELQKGHKLVEYANVRKTGQYSLFFECLSKIKFTNIVQYTFFCICHSRAKTLIEMAKPCVAIHFRFHRRVMYKSAPTIVALTVSYRFASVNVKNSVFTRNS